MEHSPLKDRRTRQLVGLGSSRPHALIGLQSSRVEVVVSDETEDVAIESEHYPELRCAKLDRAGDDRIEDRLHVGRRGRDDPQNFARGRLLLKRLLRLVEQPNVFNGNDRLVSKGLQEFHMTGAERTRFGVPHDDDSNHFCVAQHRYPQTATQAKLPVEWAREFGYSAIGL